MISKLSFSLAGYFADKNVYGHEKINVYKYGFELLLSTLLNLLGILLISLTMGTIAGAAFFCLAFIPLRLAAGGYHAKHHWSCILGFNVIFLGFTFLHRYIDSVYALPYALLAIALSSLLLWSFAPVEASNKPLKEAQRVAQRKQSVSLACVNLALLLLFYAFSILRPYADFLAFYSSGALAASLSLVVAVIVNRENGADENVAPEHSICDQSKGETVCQHTSQRKG